jgi:hypothetical protein
MMVDYDTIGNFVSRAQMDRQGEQPKAIGSETIERARAVSGSASLCNANG